LCVGTLVRLVLGGARVAGFSLQNEHRPKPATPNKYLHTVASCWIYAT